MSILTQNRNLILICVGIILVSALVFFSIPGKGAPEAPEEHESVAIEETSTDVAVEKSGINTTPKITQEEVTETPSAAQIPMVDTSTVGPFLAILKDVGEAAYSHFGLMQEDFLAIKQAGFDVI